MEDKQSQISTFIGMGLIFLLLYLWMQYSAPTQPAQEQQSANTTQTTDSNQTQSNGNAVAATPSGTPADTSTQQQGPDQDVLLAARFGPFAPSAKGQEQFYVLENELVRVTFNSKGGRIKEVFLKNFEKVNTDTAGNDLKSPVRLLEDSKNRFEYELNVNGAGKVLTSDLYFKGSKSGNTVTFRADAGEGRYLEQVYTLSPDNYRIDYQVGGQGLNNVLAEQAMRLNWTNYLDKLEKNQQYERSMSSVYFKAADESADYCNCRDNDVESLGEKPVSWFAHSSQFFNTSIMANNFAFRDFVGETQMFKDDNPDLKLLKSNALVPLNNGTASMTIYAGPNEFERLRAFGVSLEDIIPFGASVFGAINRWVVHPIFDFLSRFIGSQGIVILVLTLLVKLLLYPLTYRMVLSQSKMAALKPRLEALKKKHG
ncbi:MAG: membrane protein insertase YidC, partial [Saprospiraceae bacterium]|nr:membrane protein insertase YidC [Saprospiraceae bacterium]